MENVLIALVNLVTVQIVLVNNQSPIFNIKIGFKLFMETTVIWKEFSASLKSFIRSRIKDRDAVDDILQEVFIKIHLNIHSLKKQKSIKSWIFTIANNVIIDYFKKSNKSSNLEIEIPVVTEAEIHEEHSAKDCILPLIKNLPTDLSFTSFEASTTTPCIAK